MKEESGKRWGEKGQSWRGREEGGGSPGKGSQEHAQYGPGQEAGEDPDPLKLGVEIKSERKAGEEQKCRAGRKRPRA